MSLMTAKQSVLQMCGKTGQQLKPIKSAQITVLITEAEEAQPSAFAGALADAFKKAQR